MKIEYENVTENVPKYAEHVSMYWAVVPVPMVVYECGYVNMKMKMKIGLQV